MTADRSVEIFFKTACDPAEPHEARVMTHTVDVLRDSNSPRAGDVQDVEESQEKLEKATVEPQDTFGDEEFAEVKYKVLNWW